MTQYRNPLQHRVEEHDYLNWAKATRKRMNLGDLKEPRLSMFKELLALCEKYRKKKQYTWMLL